MIQFFDLSCILCEEALAARLACGDAEKAQENVDEGKRTKAASADSSYYSESNVKYADWVPGLINAWDCMQAVEREDIEGGGTECTQGYVPRQNQTEDGLFDMFMRDNVIEHVSEIKDSLLNMVVNLKPRGVGMLEALCLEKVLENTSFL